MIGPNTFFIDTMKLGWAMARLGMESQQVMAWRLSGLAGLWTLPNGEAERMIAEKPKAFADAWMRGTMALVHGASHPGALGASLHPLQRKARANNKRLSKRALKR